jgi:hypothetical protein
MAAKTKAFRFASCNAWHRSPWWCGEIGMSASLRNQRLRVYAYENVGVNGVPDERYTFCVERWGRVNALGGQQFTVGEQGEHLVTAIAEFSDEVDVPANGIIVSCGVPYFVRGVLHRPINRSIDVLCESCDDTRPTLVDGPGIA